MRFNFLAFFKGRLILTCWVTGVLVSPRDSEWNQTVPAHAGLVRPCACAVFGREAMLHLWKRVGALCRKVLGLRPNSSPGPASYSGEGGPCFHSSPLQSNYSRHQHVLHLHCNARRGLDPSAARLWRSISRSHHLPYRLSCQDNHQYHMPHTPHTPHTC